jgi:hypothetical protein
MARTRAGVDLVEGEKVALIRRGREGQVYCVFLGGAPSGQG